jgi:copper(I)-binding protein
LFTSPVRPGRRAAAAAALVAGSALVLSGCSAGQISQTADQAPAINGNNAQLGQVSLRNVYIVYPNAQEYTNKEGGRAALAFVAVNEDPDEGDRLTRISTDAGNVSLGQPTDLPAGGKLVAEAPGTNVTPVEEQTEGNVPIRVEVTDLKQDLVPGLTIPFTFAFDRAGEVTLQVPIDAGDAPRFESEQSSAGEHGGGAEGGTSSESGDRGATGGGGAGGGGGGGH